MISKTSTGYWSTGITVKYRERASTRHGVPSSGWSASLDFLDDGFCDDDPDSGAVSTQGTLATRYFVADGERVSGLSQAIDTLLIDAARLGIQFGKASAPQLYYEGDGESAEWPPPEGWQATLAAEAARIGWETY